MKINAIGVQNQSFYGKMNCNTKKQAAPSFQADYDNKPVPPAGKAIAALSALALLSAMVYKVSSDREEKNEVKGTPIEFNQEPETDNTYRFEDYDVSKGDEQPAVKEKHNYEPEETEEIEDTLAADTAHTHNVDSAIKREKEVIGHFGGGAYKVINKGDTLVLVPLYKNSGAREASVDSVSIH